MPAVDEPARAPGVLLVAHRAGNDPGRARSALTAGCDLLELDVHLRWGRLEVRHAKSLGPLPWLWERWYLVREPRVLLPDLLADLPRDAPLLLDLKGWQPWLGHRVRDGMRGWGSYTVCGRAWRALAVFRSDPEVRVVHSARNRVEVARLERRIGRLGSWGACLHREHVTEERVARLRAHAEVVLTWPVDTVAEYDQVVAAGVGAVICDDLAVLAARTRD